MKKDEKLTEEFSEAVKKFVGDPQFNQSVFYIKTGFYFILF